METNNNASDIAETPQEEAVQEQSATTASHKGEVGPLVGVGIIVVLLILVGLYLWGTSTSKQPTTPSPAVSAQNVSGTPQQGAPAADTSAAIGNSVDSFDTAAFDAQINGDLKSIDAILK